MFIIKTNSMIYKCIILYFLGAIMLNIHITVVGFVGLYVLYVLVVCIGRYLRQKMKSKDRRTRQTDISSKLDK